MSPFEETPQQREARRKWLQIGCRNGLYHVGGEEIAASMQGKRVLPPLPTELAEPPRPTELAEPPRPTGLAEPPPASRRTHDSRHPYLTYDNSVRKEWETRRGLARGLVRMARRYPGWALAGGLVGFLLAAVWLYSRGGH